MDDLKPCPFCGGEPELCDHRLLWSVECKLCGVIVLGDKAPEPEGEMPDDFWERIRVTAIRKWNRRQT